MSTATRLVAVATPNFARAAGHRACGAIGPPRARTRAAPVDTVLYTAEDFAQSLPVEKVPEPPGDDDRDDPPTLPPPLDCVEKLTHASVSGPVTAEPDTRDHETSQSAVLEDGARAASAPWVPFSPSGSVCFEVVLDLTLGFENLGVSFEPGPDGRPRVQRVTEHGIAHGELASGDVLLETTVVVTVEDAGVERGKMIDGENKKTLVQHKTWRDTKDVSFDECMSQMRTNFQLDDSSNNVSQLQMRLCRDYAAQNAIPMRGHESFDVTWSTDDSGSADDDKTSDEWNEEAIASGREWAARQAAGDGRF